MLLHAVLSATGHPPPVLNSLSPCLPCRPPPHPMWCSCVSCADPTHRAGCYWVQPSIPTNPANACCPNNPPLVPKQCGAAACPTHTHAPAGRAARYWVGPLPHIPQMHAPFTPRHFFPDLCGAAVCRAHACPCILCQPLLGTPPQKNPQKHASYTP